MEPVYPDEYAIPASEGAVWAAVLDEPTRGSGGKILARSETEHLLSWSERIVAAQDESELRQAEADEVGIGGMAITTLRVAGTTSSCRLRINRVYYGPRTMPEMAYSRGVSSRQIYERVCRKLGIAAAD